MRHAPLRRAWTRVGVGGVVGVVTAAALWTTLGPLAAGASGWVALVLSYGVWTAFALLPFDSEQTQSHATTEDPGARAVAVILTLAALASLVGVAALLAGARQAGRVPIEALLGAAAVAASWVLVHLLYTIQYARAYYAQPTPAAIDFEGGPPDYHDFAYLAFTIGMTYQVSDTTLETKAMRRLALRHALLSYLLGAVVLACTINLVVQLASQSG